MTTVVPDLRTLGRLVHPQRPVRTWTVLLIVIKAWQPLCAASIYGAIKRCVKIDWEGSCSAADRRHRRLKCPLSTDGTSFWAFLQRELSASCCSNKKRHFFFSLAFLLNVLLRWVFLFKPKVLSISTVWSVLRPCVGHSGCWSPTRCIFLHVVVFGCCAPPRIHQAQPWGAVKMKAAFVNRSKVSLLEQPWCYWPTNA